jgi:hypothetical protein
MTRKIIATMGLTNSGTNLLKNVLIELLNLQNKYPYKYQYFPHAGMRKKGHEGTLYFDVEVLNRFSKDLSYVIFNHRNGFDRRLSGLVRGIFKDRKGAAPSGKDINIDDYKSEIATIVIKLINNTTELRNMLNGYKQGAVLKKRLENKCSALGATCVGMMYEQFYENFDFIFGEIKKMGVSVSDEDRDRISKKYSIDNVFKLVRSGSQKAIHKKHRLLANHVSQTKGEPYYWTRFINFEDELSKLSAEDRDLFIKIVEDYPHDNLPVLW